MNRSDRNLQKRHICFLISSIFFFFVTNLPETIAFLSPSTMQLFVSSIGNIIYQFLIIIFGILVSFFLKWKRLSLVFIVIAIGFLFIIIQNYVTLKDINSLDEIKTDTNLFQINSTNANLLEQVHFDECNSDTRDTERLHVCLDKIYAHFNALNVTFDSPDTINHTNIDQFTFIDVHGGYDIRAVDNSLFIPFSVFIDQFYDVNLSYYLRKNYGITKDTPLVIFCEGGYSSTVVSKLLVLMGYNRIVQGDFQSFASSEAIMSKISFVPNDKKSVPFLALPKNRFIKEDTSYHVITTLDNWIPLFDDPQYGPKIINLGRSTDFKLSDLEPNPKFLCISELRCLYTYSVLKDSDIKNFTIYHLVQ